MRHKKERKTEEAFRDALLDTPEWRALADRIDADLIQTLPAAHDREGASRPLAEP